MSVYHFFVNQSDYANKALEQYEATVATAREWDDVFEGKAVEALQIAKEWLESEGRRAEWRLIADKWKGIADNIIRKMPLDEHRVQVCKEMARAYHQSESFASQLATVADHVNRTPVELKSRCRLQLCPEKREVTLLAYGSEEVLGNEAKADIVQAIVKCEIHYILNGLLESKTTHPMRIKYLSYDQITESVQRIRNAGYEPAILVISPQHFALSWQNDVTFRLNIVHEGRQRYISIDGNTSLKILEYGSEYGFVLDKKAGKWMNFSPLEITITEHPVDPLKVQVLAQEKVAYQVVNPEAVEIYEFPNEGVLSQPEKSEERSLVRDKIPQKKKRRIEKPLSIILGWIRDKVIRY
jgi:hypothetical protein